MHVRETIDPFRGGHCVRTVADEALLDEGTESSAVAGVHHPDEVAERLLGGWLLSGCGEGVDGHEQESSGDE